MKLSFSFPHLHQPGAMHDEMNNLLATVGLHPGDASEGDQQPQTHDIADNIDGECLHKLPSNLPNYKFHYSL